MYGSGFIVMTMEAKPKRTIRKQVEERASTHLCLHCNEPVFRRGLCPHHHHKFRMKLLSKPAAERGTWEQEQIREGKILPPGFVRQLGVDNPFEDEE